jgi:hypothetical protein
MLPHVDNTRTTSNERATMTTTQITEAPTPVSYLSLTGGNMEAGDIATFWTT